MHRNTQFMEKLFTTLMTGAYGAVMVWMFAAHYLNWNPGERSLLSLVTPWIQYTIFIGGIILLALFLIQLFTIRVVSDGHHHTHDHEHHHHHIHGEECHHEGGEHAHHHHPEEGDHECCDHGHDHGWNPIRYIPLLVPLILILMGLPDTRMIESFEKYRIEAAIKESRQTVVNEQFYWMFLGALSAPNEVFPQVAFSTAFIRGVQSIIDELDDEAKDVPPVLTDLAQLENVAKNPALIPQYEQYRKVQLEGMFNLEEVHGNVTFFRVVRFRMACCLTDSRPAMIMCATKKPLHPSLLEQKKVGTKWVKVQGRLKFGPGHDGKMIPFLKAVSVEPATTPPFPYLS